MDKKREIFFKDTMIRLINDVYRQTIQGHLSTRIEKKSEDLARISWTTSLTPKSSRPISIPGT